MLNGIEGTKVLAGSFDLTAEDPRDRRGNLGAASLDDAEWPRAVAATRGRLPVNVASEWHVKSWALLKSSTCMLTALIPPQP